MMYSSAIYDLELSPSSTNGSASAPASLALLAGSDGGAAALGSFPVPAPYRYAFKGTLEDAQLRKVRKRGVWG